MVKKHRCIKPSNVGNNRERSSQIAMNVKMADYAARLDKRNQVIADAEMVVECNYSDDCKATAEYYVMSSDGKKLIGFFPMCARHAEELKGTRWARYVEPIVADDGSAEVVPCDSCSYPSVELYRIGKGHYANDSKYMSTHWKEDEHIITLCPACYKHYPNS